MQKKHSRLNTNNYQRHCRNISSMAQNVIQFTFIICHTRAHTALHAFHGKYFNTNINRIAKIKS